MKQILRILVVIMMSSAVHAAEINYEFLRADGKYDVYKVTGVVGPDDVPANRENWYCTPAGTTGARDGVFFDDLSQEYMRSISAGRDTRAWQTAWDQERIP